MSSGPTPRPDLFQAGGLDLYAAQSQALGSAGRCPHCNGVAGVDTDPELGTVCKLCGAPRIPLPEGVTPSDALLAAEKKADRARRARALWRGAAAAGGVGLGATAILVLLVGLVSSFGWAMAVGALFGFPAALMLFGGIARSGSKSKEIARELDVALSAAALDLARAGQAATPADLARGLGVSAHKAEELHALVAVEAMTDVDTHEAVAASSRVRVGPARSDEPMATSPTRLPPDPRFDALERELRRASERPSATVISGDAEREAQAAEEQAADEHGSEEARQRAETRRS